MFKGVKHMPPTTRIIYKDHQAYSCTPENIERIKALVHEIGFAVRKGENMKQMWKCENEYPMDRMIKIISIGNCGDLKVYSIFTFPHFHISTFVLHLFF